MKNKKKSLDRLELTKKEVDTLTSSSLSDDNTLKQCKIKLDEILHRQPKSRMKYDRDGNTLSISSSDDGNTNKSLSSDDKLLSHQCEHRPLKIQWTTSSEESSSSTLSVVKFNSNLSENFIRKEILFQIKTFPEATQKELHLCIDDVTQKIFKSIDKRSAYLAATKKRLSTSLIEYFASDDGKLNAYQIEMIPSFKLLLKYLANNLVWDIFYHNDTLVCSCPCSQFHNNWKSTFMLKKEFCSKNKPLIKQAFRCKSRQLSPSELKAHLKVNSRLDIIHKLVYDFYQNAHCTFLPLESFVIRVENHDQKHFSLQNMLHDVTTKYYKHIKLSRYINLYYDLVKMVPSMTTPKRKLKMYIFGSTIGPSRSPKYCHKNNIEHQKMLPRPMSYCKPGSKAWNYMNQPWFCSLVKDMEMFTMQHVTKFASNCSNMNLILRRIKYIEDNIPSSLRICGTIFTQMVLVGENNISSDMPLHLDKQDLLSCILTLGDVKSGGATQYYSGDKVNNNNKLLHEIEFVHGRIQIGQYDKIVHGVQSWIGTRLTVNLNIKIPLIQHFEMEGSSFYDKYVSSGYKDTLIVL